MRTFRWLPGLALATGIAVVVVLLHKWVGLGPIDLDPVTAALLVGIVVGNLLGRRPGLEPGLKLAQKGVLNAAVILLGASLNLLGLVAVGWKVALGIVLALLVVLVVARPLGRVLGVPPTSALFISVGTAICGSSAIAAVAATIDEEVEADVGISVAVVNLLGGVWMLLLPPLFAAVHLSSSHSAVLLGGSLQAVGHVVGAASGMGDVVLETATGVKMGRVALLLPLVLVLGMWKGKAKGSRSSARPPGYLVGFILLSVLFTAGALPAELVLHLKTVAKWLLTIAMAGIGMSVQLSMLRTAGPRAMVLGLLLFCVQLGLVLGGLMW